MSIDPYEAEQEEWYAHIAAKFYEEHKEQAISEFVTERLRSYYLTNPDVTVAALRMYKEGIELENISTTAAVVFFSAAIELALKSALLKPVVYGLVHNESLAVLVAELAVKHVGIDKLRDLLLGILEEYGRINLNKFHIEGHAKPLWEEMREIQNVRNAIVHRGQIPDSVQIQLAKEIVTMIIGNFLPSVLNSLGLRLVKGGAIAGK